MNYFGWVLFSIVSRVLPTVLLGCPASALDNQSAADRAMESGGFEKAAAIAKNYVLNRNSRWFSNVPLKTMLEGSHTDVATVTVTECTSELSGDNSRIDSECNASIQNLLKGSIRESVKFRVRGGKVTFPNGTSATDNTSEWKLLQKGKDYLVVLEDETHPPNYWPVNSCEGLFGINSTNNTVDACAAHDQHAHNVVEDIKGMSLQTFLARVKQIIAEEHPPSH